MTPIKKELRRRTVDPFLHYKRPVIIEIVPGDVIRLRLAKQKSTSAVSIRIQDLYFELVKRRVARLRAERKKQRTQRRKNK
jgi:hypothetical protein